MNKSAVCLLITLLFLASACTTNVVMQSSEHVNAVSVQGVAEFEETPDLAKIRFRIETRGFNVKEAQKQNKDLANTVVDALKKAGVKDSEIETKDYRIERWQEWTRNEMADKGYRVSHALTVSTKNLGAVGELLDVGVIAGVNLVESISFQLSDEKEKQVKSNALSTAARNAKEKAEALAQGSGVSLGKVRSISENSFVVLPYERFDMAMTVKAEAPTPISPESVRVNAHVSVVYELS